MDCLTRGLRAFVTTSCTATLIHDDDNNYDRKEEPNYTSYKEGAKAGMSFIKRSDKEKDQHANP
jgi:hypothetical protein